MSSKSFNTIIAICVLVITLVCAWGWFNLANHINTTLAYAAAFILGLVGVPAAFYYMSNAEAKEKEELKEQVNRLEKELNDYKEMDKAADILGVKIERG